MHTELPLARPAAEAIVVDVAEVKEAAEGEINCVDVL
jgi:hypothetical protein